jgi:hypothetical protein
VRRCFGGLTFLQGLRQVGASKPVCQHSVALRWHLPACDAQASYCLGNSSNTRARPYVRYRVQKSLAKEGRHRSLARASLVTCRLARRGSAGDEHSIMHCLQTDLRWRCRESIVQTGHVCRLAGPSTQPGDLKAGGVPLRRAAEVLQQDDLAANMRAKPARCVSM